MTAPSVPTPDGLAEVLAGVALRHRPLAARLDGSVLGCACDWKPDFTSRNWLPSRDQYAVHLAAEQAAALVPWVAQQRAEAWDEGWDYRDDCDPNGAVLTRREAAGDDEMNPYRADRTTDRKPPPTPLTETVRLTSRAISGSYPSNLDPEAHMWRRCGKVSEEAGEVTEALLGYIGENPRKGETHALDDVIGELLDVANCALGAVDHLQPDADPVALLTEHSRVKWERLQAALARADRIAPTTEEQL